jgi:hypothetical protein
VESLVALNGLAHALGFEVATHVIWNESLIQRARNNHVTAFMDTPDATHLMFIDSDVQFSAASILRMLAKDKEVICGLYSKKGIDMDMMTHLARTRPDLTRE